MSSLLQVFKSGKTGSNKEETKEAKAKSTSARGENADCKPAANRPIPTGFQFSGSAKELHGEPVYCVSWSTDVFDDIDPEPDINESNDDDDDMVLEDKKMPARPSSRSSESSMPSSEASGESEALLSTRCFATCGGNQVTLYEINISSPKRSKKDGIMLRQAYLDADEEEKFFACAFGGRSFGRPYGFSPLDNANPTVLPQSAEELHEFTDQPKKKRFRSDDDSTPTTEEATIPQTQLYEAMTHLESFDGPQLLCVAGFRGVIKVIDTVRRTLFMTLSGHGNEIYDLKFSPRNEWLMLSASKDESVRLWNVKTATCVAIFAGHEGHRDSILSLGWHPFGKKFVSGGMDTTVKLWSMEEGYDVHDALAQSENVRARAKNAPATVPGTEPFRTVYEQMPYYSSGKIHTDYIDCVQFVGDLVLSKSTRRNIVLWKPELCRQHKGNKASKQRLPNDLVALREFELTHCDVWFIRFATDVQCQILAIGNRAGEIRLWEIGAGVTKKHFCKLTYPQCCSTVRMVSFSPDAKCLVSCCDDGTIWKWDAVFGKTAKT